MCDHWKGSQVCGTLYSEELRPKPGLIAGTFNGALSAIIAGEKTMTTLERAFGEWKIRDRKLSFKLRNSANTTCKVKLIITLSWW